MEENEKLSEGSIKTTRDQLIEELKLIYKFAPATNSKAYKKAQDALRINEELTFNDEEIDQFLPNELKFKSTYKE
mgnify:FL=1